MGIVDGIAVVGLLLLVLGLPGAIVAVSIVWSMRRFSRLVSPPSRLLPFVDDVPRTVWPEWIRVLRPARTLPASVPRHVADPATSVVSAYRASAWQLHGEVSAGFGSPTEFEIAATVARARLTPIDDLHFEWSQYDFAASTISWLQRATSPVSDSLMAAALISRVQHLSPLDVCDYESLGISAATMEVVALLQDPKLSWTAKDMGIDIAGMSTAPSPLDARGRAIWAALLISAAEAAASHARGRFLTA